jgi:hypothetical protein
MRNILALFVLASLAGCGGDDGADHDFHPSSAATSASRPAAPEASSPEVSADAELSDIHWQASEAGITPFISFVRLTGERLAKIQSVSFVIQPKPGTVSKPVRVTYSRAALESRGRLLPGELRLPVFGLYAGYDNAVSLMLTFQDCSTQTLAGTITTDPYSGPSAFYDSPLVIKARAPGADLGFDFFAMKSGVGTPVIVDTDGALRWVGVSTESSISSAFTDNGFVIGDQRSMKVRRLELDGTEVAITPVSTYRRFHHNIDPGKTGLLMELDTATDRETTIAEFTLDRGFYKEWDFAKIVRDYMNGAGDDASLFVRPPIDWFHTNATLYDPRDDSLIVSAREHFIMAVDYETGAIRWVLGDPTKYWASFPSLRAKALTLTAGLYPIGQHSLSITSDGLLLTFNAGNPSEFQPAGAPIGESRSYSAVSAYRIDPVTMTATEVWRFDYGQTLYSDHCSSAYEAPGKSLLVSYARADNRLHARLVGLDAGRQVVFDFQYDSRGCNTAWNAVPIALENLSYL